MVGFAAYIIIIFFELKYLLPVSAVILALFGVAKLTTSWDTERKMIINRLNRPKVTAWDGKAEKFGRFVVFGLVLLAILALVHLLYWADHLGRMLQLYLGASTFIFVDFYQLAETHFRKQAGFLD